MAVLISMIVAMLIMAILIAVLGILVIKDGINENTNEIRDFQLCDDNNNDDCVSSSKDLHNT